MVSSIEPDQGIVEMSNLGQCDLPKHFITDICGFCLFVCVDVLRPSQSIGVMLSVVSLPYYTFTGQA